MPLGPDPERARAAVARLDALRDTGTAAEDDVLACLVVTGEPGPQRVLDDWLDQVADTLRALGETAADLTPALSRFAVGASSGGSPELSRFAAASAPDEAPVARPVDAAGMP